MKTGGNLHDFGASKDLLSKMQNALTIKEKIVKPYLINLKHLCSSKDINKRVKKTDHREGEEFYNTNIQQWTFIQDVLLRSNLKLSKRSYQIGMELENLILSEMSHNLLKRKTADAWSHHGASAEAGLACGPGFPI